MTSCLRNVRIVDKGTKPSYLPDGIFEHASDVTVYNLFEQDWQTLVDEGLTHIFGDDPVEFERRKAGEPRYPEWADQTKTGKKYKGSEEDE